jgi:hypothetical protein
MSDRGRFVGTWMRDVSAVAAVTAGSLADTRYSGDRSHV